MLLGPVLAGVVPGLSPEALSGVLREARQWRVLGNSVFVAAGAAAGALCLGAPAGYFIARFGRRFRGLLVCALAAPLVVPNYVMAVAWIGVLGRQGVVARAFGMDEGLVPLYTPLGAALVYALTHFPIVALTTGAAAWGLDRRIEEAGQLHAGRWHVFRTVTLPLIAPMVVAGTALVFLVALLGFTVPSLLQVQTYPVEIYTRFSSFYDLAGAGTQALPMLVLGALACAALGRNRRRVGVLAPWKRDGVKVASAGLRPGSWVAPLAMVYCWMLVGMVVGLPLAVLCADAWPPSTLWEAWRSAGGELATSLLLAGAAATLCVGMASVLARRRLFGGTLIAAAPYLVSGPVLGVGLIRLWNHAGAAGWVYDSFAVLVLACVARYFVFAYVALRTALARLDPAIEDAAANCGAGPMRRFFTVVAPLLAPAVAGAWGLVFVLVLGELDCVVLVTPPGWTPLSVRLFSLLHYGPGSLVAALSLLTAVTTLATAAACWALVRALTRSH